LVKAQPVVIIFPNVNNNNNNKQTMKFREFWLKIKALPAFNLNDARKLDLGFHRQQLNYWHNKGYISLESKKMGLSSKNR
jgi:hypothetical protein